MIYASYTVWATTRTTVRYPQLKFLRLFVIFIPSIEKQRSPVRYIPHHLARPKGLSELICAHGGSTCYPRACSPEILVEMRRIETLSMLIGLPSCKTVFPDRTFVLHREYFTNRFMCDCNEFYFWMNRVKNS